MFVVVFVPIAARQTAEARDWWYAHRDKAPTAFEDDLVELMRLLEHAPRAVGIAVAQRPGVRRAFMVRVRYHVYFRITGRRVQVLAIWHASRARLPDV